MKCAELSSMLTQSNDCVETDSGVRFTTHCLYPSSDPVEVFVAKNSSSFRVTDGGGAWRAAQSIGKAHDNMFEKACRRHSVTYRGGIIFAETDASEWVRAAVLAVANASMMAARHALETQERVSKSLNSMIYESLARVVPKHYIARDFEYKGRSGHVWPIDFAVTQNEVMLIKSVSQNGNSINSNYATFGDIGEAPKLSKLSVFDGELKADSAALLRQVASLVPLRALDGTVGKGL
ncbi:MAG: hypothetical protein AAFY51_08450 [Pseudomonadota bacterium]